MEDVCLGDRRPLRHAARKPAYVVPLPPEVRHDFAVIFSSSSRHLGRPQFPHVLDCEAELLEFLNNDWAGKSTMVLLTTLRRFQSLYFSEFKYGSKLLKSEVRESRANSVTDDTHNKLAWKKVRGKFSPPLLFVARDQVGPDLQPIGSISTDPGEIDSIVTRIWTKVYDGNVSATNVLMHMVSFFSEFLCYVFCRTSFHLAPFSGADLFEACVHGPKTAGGMDGWSPDDWALLPLEAFEEVAYLLRAIEEGAPWPTGILHGRAVFSTPRRAVLCFHPHEVAHAD